MPRRTKLKYRLEKPLFPFAYKNLLFPQLIKTVENEENVTADWKKCKTIKLRDEKSACYIAFFDKIIN